MTMSAWGELAVGDLDNPQALVSTGQLLRDDPFADFRLVIVAHPLPLSNTFDPDAWGDFAWGDTNVAVNEFAVHFSDDRLYDDDIEFHARLVNPISYRFSIPIPGQGASGTGGYGNISVENADKGFDSKLSYLWEGREFELFVGGVINRGLVNERVFTWPEYEYLTSLSCTNFEYTEDSVTFFVTDSGNELETPFPPNLYLGTGTYEGDANAEGKAKPLIFGQVFNFTPIKLADNVYQIHDGVLDAVPTVKLDGKVQTSDGATTSPFTESSTTGKFKHELATGVIYVEDSGTVTVDVVQTQKGHVDIVEDIVANYSAAGVTRFGTINESLSNYDIGIAFDGVTTVKGAVDKICIGIGWSWFYDRAGRFILCDYPNPVEASSVDTIPEDDILIEGIERLPSPKPTWRHWVGYRKNYTVQDAASLNDTLTEAQLADLTTDFLSVEEFNNITRDRFPRPTEVKLESHLLNKADAVTVALARQAFEGQRLSLFRIAYRRSFMKFNLCDIITPGTPRFGLNTKFGVIISIDEDGETQESSVNVLFVDDE